MEINRRVLKDSLCAVIAGFNIASLDGERVFIKHFGNRDKIEVDFQYSIAYKSALSKQIITNDLKEKQLIAQGLWSEEKDKEISRLENSILNLKKRKRRSLPSQIKEINKDIDKAYAKIILLKNRKKRLIGSTAETIAQTRADDFYIASSFFKDDTFKERVVDINSFDAVDNDLIEMMKIEFFSSQSSILGDGVKKLSVLKEFMNLMYLAEKPYEILGKPLADYTFFQIDLISFARHYKHIISNDPTPPEKILEDPDALDDWFEGSTNMKKIAGEEKTDTIGQATTIIGAKPEDLELLKKEGNIVSIDSEIKKAITDRPLNMQEMMKIHGIR